MDTGRCHLCHTDQPIGYCAQCGHWFCDGCKGRYTVRAWEALKQAVSGRQAACCGPLVATGSLFQVVD